MPLSKTTTSTVLLRCTALHYRYTHVVQMQGQPNCVRKIGEAVWEIFSSWLKALGASNHVTEGRTAVARLVPPCDGYTSQPASQSAIQSFSQSRKLIMLQWLQCLTIIELHVLDRHV